MDNELVDRTLEWYGSLVDDCRAIITEAVFNSRWELIAGYHALGCRISVDTNWQKWAYGNGERLTDLSNSIGVSERNLYRAIQFYEKYPQLDTVPDGKSITWNRIVTRYLPKENGEEVEEHIHIPITICSICKTRLG